LWWSAVLVITLAGCDWVEPMSASPSRRRLLQAAVLSPVVAACTREPSTPKTVSPDVALRAAAVARERALIERYRAAAASSSSDVATRTAGLVEQHEQHLTALRAPTAAPTPSNAPAPTVPTLVQLAAEERAAARAHAAAALQASRPLAAVLASLAASAASHAVVLT
jgi:hypothetical protein